MYGLGWGKVIYIGQFGKGTCGFRSVLLCFFVRFFSVFTFYVFLCFVFCILFFCISVLLGFCFSDFNGGEKKDTKAKMQVGFICTQILNEQSQKVLVAQVLKKIERVSYSEQPDIFTQYVQKLYVYEPISLLQLQTQVDTHMNSLEFPLEFASLGD